MATMMELRDWLQIQGLTVRELALEIDLPLKTAQDWVYRGVVPSAKNQAILTDYILATCAHHWVIAASNGPTSQGICRRCGHQREFMNSMESASPWGKSKAA